MRKILVLIVVALVFLLAVAGVLADAMPRPRVFEITPLSANPGEEISIRGENLRPLGVPTNGLYVWFIDPDDGGVNMVDYPYVQRMGGSWEDELVRFPLPDLRSEPYKVTVIAGATHSGVNPFYYTVGLTTTTMFTTWHSGNYVNQRLGLGWCRNSQTGSRADFLSVIPEAIVFPGAIPAYCTDGNCVYIGGFADNPPGRECYYYWGYAARPGTYFVSSTFTEASTSFVQTIVDRIEVRQVVYLPIVFR